jgi:hypothetical protein
MHEFVLLLGDLIVGLALWLRYVKRVAQICCNGCAMSTGVLLSRGFGRVCVAESVCLTLDCPAKAVVKLHPYHESASCTSGGTTGSCCCSCQLQIFTVMIGMWDWNQCCKE